MSHEVLSSNKSESTIDDLPVYRQEGYPPRGDNRTIRWREIHAHYEWVVFLARMR